nr:MAG TPA: hypothetical protein [Caudoviricetes sp.]
MYSLALDKKAAGSRLNCPITAFVFQLPEFNRANVLFRRSGHTIHSLHILGNIEGNGVCTLHTALIDVFGLDGIQQNATQDGDVVYQSRHKSGFWKLFGFCVIERHNMGEHSHTPFHGIGDPYWTNTAPQQMQERLVLPVPLSWPAVRSHLRSGMSWTSCPHSGFAALRLLRRLRNFGGRSGPLCWLGRCSGTVPQWRSMPFSRPPCPDF